MRTYSEGRRQLVVDTVAKTRECLLMTLDNRIKKFGSGSTRFLNVSESRRGLERTLSHTSTGVGTSAKMAVRKIKGGTIRGMKVLAHILITSTDVKPTSTASTKLTSTIYQHWCEACQHCHHLCEAYQH